MTNRPFATGSFCEFYEAHSELTRLTFLYRTTEVKERLEGNKDTGFRKYLLARDYKRESKTTFKIIQVGPCNYSTESNLILCSLPLNEMEM